MATTEQIKAIQKALKWKGKPAAKRLHETVITSGFDTLEELPTKETSELMDELFAMASVKENGNGKPLVPTVSNGQLRSIKHLEIKGNYDKEIEIPDVVYGSAYKLVWKYYEKHHEGWPLIDKKVFNERVQEVALHMMDVRS